MRAYCEAERRAVFGCSEGEGQPRRRLMIGDFEGGISSSSQVASQGLNESQAYIF